jgi:hypothetical protein
MMVMTQMGEEHVEFERVGFSGVVEDKANREEVGEDANDGDVEEIRGRLWGGDDGDDVNSEDLCPSDILWSPGPSDSEDE